MMRVLFLSIALLLCASSHGALLSFNFTATITTEEIATSSIGGISTGDEFSGVFAIDTGATPHSQSVGGYFGLVPNMAFGLGDAHYNGQSAPGIVDTYADGAINDFIQFTGLFTNASGITQGSYQFTFADRDANAIESPHLVDAPTSLNMERFFDNSTDTVYGSLFFNESGNLIRVDFIVDVVAAAPVPVPAALWLLLSGLGVLGSGYRSNRNPGRNPGTVYFLA